MHGTIPPEPKSADPNTRAIVKKMALAGEQIILEALSYSVSDNISRLDLCVEKMDKLVTLKDFPPGLGGDLKSLCRRIRRETHEKRVSDLIDGAMLAVRDDQLENRRAALDGISAALYEAVRSGADRDFCDQIAKRLEVLALTTRKGIDEPARREAARKTELKAETAPQGGRDRRRAIRYADPVLVLDCRGWGPYRTLNWSCYGFLADGAGKPPPVGKSLRIALRCGLLPGFEERMAGTVVKLTETGGFAIEMPNIETGILKLMNLLKKNGIPLVSC